MQHISHHSIIYIGLGSSDRDSDISSREEQSLLRPWSLKSYSLSARYELLIYGGEELTAAHQLLMLMLMLMLNISPAEAQGQLYIKAKHNPHTQIQAGTKRLWMNLWVHV